MKKKKKLNTSQLKKLVNSLDYIQTRFVNLAMFKRSSAIKHLVDKEDLINLIWKRCVILFQLIKKQPELILSTLGLVQKSKWMIFLDKLNIYNQEENLLHIQLFQILVQELILKEKDYKPFWTPAFKELSEKLSSPTEIDFPDLALNLLNASSQKQVVQSQSLMMTHIKAQNKNLQKTCYQLSTSTVVNKWEKEVIQTPTKLKNLKILLKPTIAQRKIFNEWIKTSNYVYNKTIASINSGDKINFMSLRDKLVTNRTKKFNSKYHLLTNNIKLLKKKVDIIENDQDKNENELKILKEQMLIERNNRKEIKFEKNLLVMNWECKTPKEIRAGAVNDVCKAYDTGFSNLKAGNIHYFRLGFRKITKCKKSFLLPNSFIENEKGNLKIAPDFFNGESLFVMGKKTIKKHKNIEIKNDCRIIHERNRYWICIPIPTIIQEHNPTPINYCGIDPGIRTFLTSFGNNGVVEYNYKKQLCRLS